MSIHTEKIIKGTVQWMAWKGYPFKDLNYIATTLNKMGKMLSAKKIFTWSICYFVVYVKHDIFFSIIYLIEK